MIVKRLLPVLLALAAVFPFATVLADKPATSSSPEAALRATVTALDKTFFDAYNACDLKTIESMTASDLEFYHDTGGVTLGRQRLVESLRQNICGILRRELIPGTLEVYPIKGYGAVELGEHRFCQIKTGNCDARARFVHLWHQTGSTWQLARVVSYDHHGSD
jgi:hypothetical protein